MSKAATPKTVSFDLGNFASGGMLNNVDVVVKEAKFVEWEMPGYPDTAGVYCQLTCGVMEAGEEVREAEQHIKVAKSGYFEVSEDGNYCIPSEKDQPAEKTAFHTFLQSLQTAGMPPDYLASGAADALVGINFHAVSIKREKTADNPYGGTQFLARVVHSAPWDNKGGKAKAKAKPAPAAAAAAAPARAAAAPAADTDDETEANAISMLTEYVQSTGPLPLNVCFPRLLKKFKDDERWATSSAALNTQAKVEALVSKMGGDYELAIDNKTVVSTAS